MSLPRLENRTFRLLLAWRWRRRSVLLIGADNGAHQFMPHDSRSVKYTVAIPGTAFNACNASTTPERLFDR